MKVRRGKFSGAIGNEVYVSTAHGQVVRSRPRRRPRSTPNRLRAQRNLSDVASLWRSLTAQQFAAWTVAARQEGLVPFRFFCKINGTLTAYDQPRVLFPPKRERLRPNPIEQLEILNRRGSITLRLRVPAPPASLTFVFGARWCSRGISTPRSRGTLLGRLPTPVRGWSDVTSLYLNKFSSPPPGTRVFLWTRQLYHGRTDALKQTHADVPSAEKQ